MSIKHIQGYQIFMYKCLGKGSYGDVYLGKKDDNKETVAVKIVPKKNIDHNPYLIEALNTEIMILQEVVSENVVEFLDVLESSKNYYIIQELCDGDLSQRINSKKQYSQIEAIDMLRQICNGFMALVKKGIIHRDLKPANILTKGNILKVADFGFAKQMSDGKAATDTYLGTPNYMSLQIQKGLKYTSKCDIWALGIIFYEILHGEIPWRELIKNKSVFEHVKIIENEPLVIKRKDLSPETQNFIRRCLQKKQQDRVSWDELFMHPIFKGYFTAKVSNLQFQNKLKMIMNQLRVYVCKMNLDLKKVMDSMGFAQSKKEIEFDDFHQFLQTVYPQISREEAEFCFKKTDTDNSGSISVTELKQMLLENGIKLQSQFDLVPGFQQKEGQQESFVKISEEASRKIKSCFQKLYKIIKRNNLSLRKVFSDFDRKKGSLSLGEFSLLVKKLCGSTLELGDKEVEQGFKHIDVDNSGTIQFSELESYYCRINGIPIQSNQPVNQTMIPQKQQMVEQQKVQKSSNAQLVYSQTQNIQFSQQQLNQPLNQNFGPNPTQFLQGNNNNLFGQIYNATNNSIPIQHHNLQHNQNQPGRGQVNPPQIDFDPTKANPFDILRKL